MINFLKFCVKIAGDFKLIFICFVKDFSEKFSRLSFSKTDALLIKQSNPLKLKKELEELGAEAYLFKADLNNLKQTETLIKKAFKTLKGLDCLINNASIFENDNLESFSEKSFTKHMNINLKSPAILTQNFKKAMQRIKNFCDSLN